MRVNCYVRVHGPSRGTFWVKLVLSVSASSSEQWMRIEFGYETNLLNWEHTVNCWQWGLVFIVASVCIYWDNMFWLNLRVYLVDTHRWAYKSVKENFPHCCNSMCLLLMNDSLLLVKTAFPEVPSGLQQLICVVAFWSFLLDLSAWEYLFIYSWVYARYICLSTLAQLLLHQGGHWQQLIKGTAFIALHSLCYIWITLI